jgi:hypothetical protein
MSAKKNILEVKIDQNMDDRNDVFVKILQSNKEFVDFFKNFSDKDANTLIEIMDLLKEKGAKTSMKSMNTKKTMGKKTMGKKTGSRRTSLQTGGFSQAELRKYILMGIYFIYAALISFGVYEGSDSLMVGINQVTRGTCNGLANRITGSLGFGTRHPFCNVYTSFIDLLIRAFTNGESFALATVAVYIAAPVATIYIQKNIIESIANTIANRLGDARAGQTQMEYNLPGQSLIAGAQNLQLSFPTTTAERRAIIPQPEHDARTHPSRRSNISRRSRSRSRSSSPAPRSGGRRLSKRKTMKRKTMKRRA